MMRARTLIGGVLLCVALGGGVAALGARAQDAPIRDDIQAHPKFSCTIATVAKSGDTVTAVSLAINPADPNAAAWPAWLESSIGASVQLSVSTVWHEPDDKGKVSDNAGGAATVDLEKPGDQHFPTALGTKLNIFYTPKG